MDLSFQEKLDLKRLLSQSDCEDNTNNIRKLKHSNKIAEDIMSLTSFLKEMSARNDMDPQTFDKLARETAPFLVNNYMEIYNKVMKNELNLSIMARLLEVLQAIENGQVGQHEGSVMVGKILKSLYLDSAIRHGENLDKEHATEKPPLNEGKTMSWVDYKKKPSVLVRGPNSEGSFATG